MTFIGELVGCWIFYALVSLIFKHKGGLIFLVGLFVLDLIPVIAGVQNPSMLISILVCFCLVYFIEFFQVKNNNKNKDSKK